MTIATLATFFQHWGNRQMMKIGITGLRFPLSIDKTDQLSCPYRQQRSINYRRQRQQSSISEMPVGHFISATFRI